eukprot:12028110-Alexandrium_andersonii.AAC.1
MQHGTHHPQQHREQRSSSIHPPSDEKQHQLWCQQTPHSALAGSTCHASACNRTSAWKVPGGSASLGLSLIHI